MARWDAVRRSILSTRIPAGPFFLLLSASVVVSTIFAEYENFLSVQAENLGHFRLLGIGAAATGALCSRRSRWVLYLSAACVLAHGWAVLLWSRPFSFESRSGLEGTVGPHAAQSIIYANLGVPESRDARILGAWIRANDPDFVALVEFDPESARDLAPVLDRYPFGIRRIREDRFGAALLSRIPVSESRTIAPDSSQTPILQVRFDSPPLTVFVVHVAPPKNVDERAQRNGALAVIARLAAAETHPVVVIGDLNTTERSAGYESLAPVLRDSRRGFGWSPSWRPLPDWISPANWFVGIPIDHAFVSPSVRLADRQLGPPYGSDHLPLKLSFSVPILR